MADATGGADGIGGAVIGVFTAITAMLVFITKFGVTILVLIALYYIGKAIFTGGDPEPEPDTLSKRDIEALLKEIASQKGKP